MSIPFSRSMRSLNADSLRPSLVGLVIAIVLLVAWAGWFFLAQITIYETGQIVGLTSTGTVVANFPPEALGRIHRGQPAFLRPNVATENPIESIPAIVADVTNDDPDGRIQVELFALPSAASLAFLQNNPTGQVEIEVERLSPATLVMRASEQILDTPQVAPVPQDRLD